MSILSAIGSAIGLMVGGPAGAAIGSGLGSLAGGGSFADAFRTGIMNLGIGSLPGGQAMIAQNAMGAMFGGGGDGGGRQVNPLAQLFAPDGGAGAESATRTAAPTMTGAARTGGLGPFLTGMAQNPLVMASLMEAFQPRGSLMTPLQEQQVATGERLPDYRGTAAPDFRYGGDNPRFAMGGYIEGPGTGTSDSIPAMIYQNGGPVQEAMLSDGEFVMTERAVRGAGGGDRAKGAAKMYEMMDRLERRA